MKASRVIKLTFSPTGVHIVRKQEPSIVIDWGDLETMRTTKSNLQRYLIQDMVSMNPESAALLKTVALESGNGSAAGAT